MPKRNKKISIPSTVVIGDDKGTKIIDIANITEKKFTFSFEKLDRYHELFNLGASETRSESIDSAWYLSLFDCLKDVSNKNFQELKGGTYDLHPVDWKNANVKPPEDEQNEFWQFRVCKSKGRVIGVRRENTFYIVWLDAYHNLIDSPGYGGVDYRRVPKSEYEIAVEAIDELYSQVKSLEQDISILNSVCDTCEYKNK